MAKDTQLIAIDDGYLSRERALDWLTGLLPVTIISLLYYRWQAAALEVLAIGGYLMAAALLARPCGRSWNSFRLPQAAVAALLGAFCLPAGAPFWLAALLGGLTAAFDAVPVLISRRFPNSRLSRPLLHPSISAYLVVRLLFPTVGQGFTMPVQWTDIDTLTYATPLEAFSGTATRVTDTQLFFGIQAGAIGETCVAAILLSAVYLLLRRRVRLIAPGCMLLCVSLLSLWLWHSPMYSLLAGSTALTALLLADRTYAPASPFTQAIMGVTAGCLLVLLRRFGPWDGGAAIALLATQLLTPLFPGIGHGLQALSRRCAPYVKRGAAWGKAQFLRLCRWRKEENQKTEK